MTVLTVLSRPRRVAFGLPGGVFYAHNRALNANTYTIPAARAMLSGPLDVGVVAAL